MKIAVLGGGSWGTTLAIMLAQGTSEVSLWEYNNQNVLNMRADNENKAYLAGYPFPPRLTVTNDIEQTIQKADLCLSVVPSSAVRETMEKIKGSISSKCIVVSCTKGLEQGSHLRMTKVIQECLHKTTDADHVAVLTGPSHAEEVVRGIPTSVVVSCESLDTAHIIQKVMSNERFRLYVNNDVIGSEIAGAIKNVIAIAAGISSGLGFGDNTTGALLTRGLAEITRCGVALGGKANTFAGLAGMGDLITTCCSKHSRNRFVGEELGKGQKLNNILSKMVMVAEGVRTTKVAWELAMKYDIEMPITEQINKILFEDADPLRATTELMTRRLKVED